MLNYVCLFVKVLTKIGYNAYAILPDGFFVKLACYHNSLP